MKKTMYVVFTTHYDVGYTKLPSEVVAIYRGEMLDRVLTVGEATRDAPEGKRFVWTSKAWPLYDSLQPDRNDPTRIAATEAMIRRGQFRWTITPTTTLTESCGLEEYVRSLYLSRRLTEAYGFRPEDAKKTDVPGHTWFLPGVLASAGVKFIQIGANPATMPADLPRLFFWEGADGTRLLTMYSAGAYGSNLLPPEDWPHNTWLALMQTNDNVGPQDVNLVQQILDRAAAEAPEWDVVVGTLADFGKALLAESPDLPVVRGDMADPWIHGVGTFPRKVAQLRTVRRELFAYEALVTLLKLHGRPVPAGFAQTVTDAYEQAILFGDHTWGNDVKHELFPRSYTPKEFAADRAERAGYARCEESWRQKAAYVERAAALVEPRLAAAMQELADSVALEGPRAVVFNPLGWAMESPFGGGEPVPPLGWRAYPLPLGKADAPTGTASADGVLENAFLRVEVDLPSGSIVSLLDKRTGHQWVEPGAGQYLYEVFTRFEISRFMADNALDLLPWYLDDFGKTGYPRDVRHRTVTPTGFTCTVDGNSLVLTAPLASSHWETNGCGAALTVRLTLPADRPYLDVAYTLEGKQATPLAEGGWFSFPLRLEGAQYRIAKTGSVIDPVADVLPGCNTDHYCTDNWVDVSDGKVGMTVVSPDAPLLSIGRRGLWRYTREGYRPEAPHLWWNAFNNQWGTNFPQWHEGDFTYRFRLIPHQGDWREAMAWRLGAEAAWELPVAYSRGPAGNLPVCASALAELSPGVMPIAFKPAEDGNGVVLRLWEAAGVAGPVTVRPGFGTGAVERTDLLEYGGEPLGETFGTRPFQVHTLRLFTP